MRRLYDDMRLAFRGLRRQPRFVSVAALTLALGIGSVTAIFSVVRGVLLKPLPYAEPNRLVNVWSNAPGLNFDQFGLSPDIYYFLRGERTAFEEMTLFRRRDANLTGAASPEVVAVAETTQTFFSTYGVAPAVGQAFAASSDVPGAPLTAVISHRLWQRRFAGNAGIAGTPLQIDGETATILGVMPRWLDETGSPDLWMPARLDPAHPPTGNFSWLVAARLKAAGRPDAAEADLAPVVRRLLDEHITGEDYRAFMANGRYRLMVHSMTEDVIGDVRQPLWILLGTVGFVLLIACANVANLFLIRAEGRQREVAVRAALGATRGALVWRQLVEAGVLAAIGGALGLLLAAVAVPALIRVAPATIPRLGAVRIDAAVVLVALGATAFAALLFGIVPAVRYTRPAILGSLRHGGRGATVDKARHRGRRLLVVIQTAMTLVLLVGSGLLLRSFARMIHTDLGFQPDHVLTFRLTLPASSYPDAPRVLDFDRRLIERLAALPGVEQAGAISVLPMTGSAPGTAFNIDGRPAPAGQLPPMIRYAVGSPGYLEAMRIQVIRGRAFDRRDLAPDSHEVLVNRALADRFWPGENPIGKRLRPSSDTERPWYTVAGVVSSVLQDGLRKDPPGLIYYPLGAPASGPARSLAYVIRGPNVAGDAAAVRAAVWALDPALPVTVVRTMDEIVDRSIVQFTFTMLTLGIAALMALVLGTIGLYGVLSYTVTLRIREIGVRLALGAQPSRVMRAIVLQGLAMSGVGLVIGVAGAVALTRLLSDLLYGTRPLDLVTFAGTSAVLLAVALVASYLPARRAASVSPLESLRAE
jgi:predicted permease